MTAVRIVFAIVGVLVALFCGFGFLASFEGSDAKFWAFRIGYAVIGVAAVVFAIVSFEASGRRRHDALHDGGSSHGV